MGVVSLFVLATSCAAPPTLEVFLSPNPDFEETSTQAVTPQYQQTPIPAPAYTPQLTTVEPVGGTQAGMSQITAQLSASLAEAQAHVHAGEARLEEQNPLEAIREFERARTLLETGVDPALQYIQQTSTIQGGVQIMSTQQLQRVQTQRAEILARLNQAYDFQALYAKQQEADRVNRLRSQSQSQLRPVYFDGGFTSASVSSRRLIERPRPEQGETAMFGESLPWLADEVAHSINRFQQRQRDFEACLLRADRYFPTVTAILANDGIPEEVAYVALIESGFQPAVVSSDGRVGLWQLSRSVARSYGLRVSSGADERKEVEASTRAFAQYLAHLHRQFGDWGLAILACEIGERDVRRAINRVGSHELRYFDSAFGRYADERTFLARLLAAMTIARNPRAYGFDVTLSNLAPQMTVQAAEQASEQELIEAPAVLLY
jgi:hypothetical protein